MTGRPTHGAAPTETRRVGPAGTAAARLRFPVVERAWGAALRHPLRWLTAWTLVLLLLHVAFGAGWLISWHYIVTGVHVLTGPHALALYVRHPELQMGPITFLVSLPFVLLPPPLGLVLAGTAMEAAGLLALREVRTLVAPWDVAGQRRWFLASLAVMAGWSELAIQYAHPDDVLALLGAAIALRLMRSGRFAAAAVVVALAIDCKPWIAPLALLLLAAPWRRWAPLALIVVAVVAVVWAPFLLDARVLGAARFTIAVSPTSSIHLLGLAHGRTPAWCRPVQLLGGAALVALSVRLRRPQAGLLLLVALRMVTDPGTHGYYDAGLLLATAVADLAALIPLATAVAVALVYLPPHLAPTDAPLQAVLRFAALAALVVIGLAVPQADPRGTIGRGRRTRLAAP